MQIKNMQLSPLVIKHPIQIPSQKQRLDGYRKRRIYTYKFEVET